MSELKTRATKASVIDFINGVAHQGRREDAKVLLGLFSQITQTDAVLWGDSIVGFGAYTYELANGKKNKFLRSGFSPRKQYLSIYVGCGMAQRPELLDRLGKHKTSRACLYINKLADVDMTVLEQIIRADFTAMNQRYPQEA